MNYSFQKSYLHLIPKNFIYLYTLAPYTPLHVFKNNKEPKKYQLRVSVTTFLRVLHISKISLPIIQDD